MKEHPPLAVGQRWQPSGQPSPRYAYAGYRTILAMGNGHVLYSTPEGRQKEVSEGDFIGWVRSQWCRVNSEPTDTGPLL